MVEKKAKPTGRRKPIWDKLPEDMRDLYLKVIWMDGYTEQAIADFLSTTKGTIVGRRNRLKIGSVGRKELKRAKLTVERFFDLLEIEKMDKLEEESGGTVVCIAPIGTVPDEPDNAGNEEMPEPIPRAVPIEAAPEPPPPAPEPVKLVSVQRPKTSPPPASDIAERTCEWPLTSGGSLKAPRQCGKPTLPGETLCEEHKRLAQQLGRKH